MAERNTYESLQAGMDSAKAADSQFDLMKGRTYIPRMSPETTKAIIEAIRARRKKKADEKTAERKKASDDYFAGEADKTAERRKASDDYFANEADNVMEKYQEKSLRSIMDAESEEDFTSGQDEQLEKEINMRPKRKGDVIEERLLKDRGNEMINKYRYGGKTKKYRK